ncbi:MAG TPA: ABC-type transport auxiliary lipoprotein family protein [Terriglobales bacterium]|nr:ABC-type transport auxiliary lipoprotein family protein [Terriglobales bacterium]
MRCGPGLLLLVLCCWGCVSLERSYPDKRYFVIEIPGDAKAASPESDRVLLMLNLHISPRYGDTSFVYRTSDTAYESDFYNQFLSSPATMISEEIRKRLSASPVFKFIIGPASQLTANYVLEGSINALYGDFRNLSAPRAVLELEFFLRSDDPAKPGILLHRSYTKSVPISQRSPEALVAGWNQALEAIVSMLLADLGNAKL